MHLTGRDGVGLYSGMAAKPKAIRSAKELGTGDRAGKPPFSEARRLSGGEALRTRRYDVAVLQQVQGAGSTQLWWTIRRHHCSAFDYPPARSIPVVLGHEEKPSSTPQLIHRLSS
jgi:hypothetical protein